MLKLWKSAFVRTPADKALPAVALAKAGAKKQKIIVLVLILLNCADENNDTLFIYFIYCFK